MSILLIGWTMGWQFWPTISICFWFHTKPLYPKKRIKTMTESWQPGRQLADWFCQRQVSKDRSTVSLLCVIVELEVGWIW